MEPLKRLLRLIGLGRPTDPHRTDAPPPHADTAHSITIQIRTDAGPWSTADALPRLYALSSQIGQALQTANAGLLDAEIVGKKTFDILTTGPDADRMWDAIAPILERHPFAPGSHALKCFGDPAPHARQERIDLHWEG